MRIFLTTLSIFFLCSFYGQNLLYQEVSVSFEDNSLLECIQIIQEKDVVKLSYSSSSIKKIKKNYTKNFEEAYLKEVLDYLTNNTNVQYKEIGGQITFFIVKKAQEEIRLSGYVRDMVSKEELIGAIIYFPELELGAVSNSYGYYNVKVPKGDIKYRASFIGYQNKLDSINANDDVVLDVLMKKGGRTLDEVLVRHQPKKGREIEETDPDLLGRSMESTAIAGEADLLKYVQLAPGVQPEQDGSSRYVVRGSGNGNNLILLDDAPIYHTTHGFGMFSVINADAVKSAPLYKEKIPAKFGERNASILDVRLKDGDLEHYHANAGIGLVSAQLNAEGPIIKNKSSFYFSSRKSILDQFISRTQFRETFPKLSFHDISFKLNYHVNANNRLFMSMYTGDDEYTVINTYNWGNKVGSIRWNHIYSDRSFSNLSLSGSLYNIRSDSDLDFENSVQDIKSYRLKYDLNLYPSSSSKISTGFMTSYRANSLGVGTQLISNPDSVVQSERSAIESAVYGQLDQDIGKKLKLKLGLRMPIFMQIGSGDTAIVVSQNFVFDTLISPSGSILHQYVNLEPRLSTQYAFNPNNTVEVNFDVMNQYFHNVTNAADVPAVELWYGANKLLPPERSRQLSFKWTRSVENFYSYVQLYSRRQTNAIDFIHLGEVAGVHFETNLAATNIKARGVETFFGLKRDRLKVELGYTLLKTEQQSDLINGGDPYPTAYDRPHYLSLRGRYELNDLWNFSGLFVYHSGTAVNFPSGQIVVDGTAFPLYINRNGERLPDYHRLDFSVVRNIKMDKIKASGQVRLSVNNVYNRHNITFVLVERDEENLSILRYYGVNYLPFLPSLSLKIVL